MLQNSEDQFLLRDTGEVFDTLVLCKLHQRLVRCHLQVSDVQPRLVGLAFGDPNPLSGLIGLADNFFRQ